MPNFSENLDGKRICIWHWQNIIFPPDSHRFKTKKEKEKRKTDKRINPMENAFQKNSKFLNESHGTVLSLPLTKLEYTSIYQIITPFTSLIDVCANPLTVLIEVPARSLMVFGLVAGEN